MRKALLAVAVALFCLSLAPAQTTDVLIEIDTGRREGVFKKSPLFRGAILATPANPKLFIIYIARKSLQTTLFESEEIKKGDKDAHGADLGVGMCEIRASVSMKFLSSSFFIHLARICFLRYELN